MHNTASRAIELLRGVRRDPGDHRTVVVGGLLLVALHLVFRAWLVYPGFFFLDDYELLSDAQDASLSTAHLLTPFNGRFMPGGRLLALLVAGAGPTNWALAATVTLVLQLGAGLAALYALVTLFGPHRRVLVLLLLYLTSALTVPATVWWSATLERTPVQLALFLAVASWVRFLRSRRRRWLLASVAAVVIGLCFGARTLLVVPVLAYLEVAYFTTGGVRPRATGLVRRHKGAALGAAATVLGYVALYLDRVPRPLTTVSPSVAMQLVDSMVGTAFLSGVVGGPWRWTAPAPPTAFADPPGWSVHVAWVLVTLVVVYSVLRRRRTARAWGLLLGYVGISTALLATSGAAAFGPGIGLDYLYSTDAAAVGSLCLGLATLPLLGATEPSVLRDEPLLRWRLPPAACACLVAAVALGGLLSSTVYARYWHEDNASEAYVRNLSEDLRSHGVVDLVDTPVPDEVMPSLSAPANTVRRFTHLLQPRPLYPDASGELATVSEDGRLRRVLIGPGPRSRPGPVANCGWLVGNSGRAVPLDASTLDGSWWLRVGYLASADSPVRVSAGSSSVATQVDEGAHSLYVRIEGSFDDVRIDGMTGDASVCVDAVEVGPPTPGGPLA